MGSGYFPVDGDDKWAVKLKEASRLIGEVITEAWDHIGDDGQYDNAASDGGYIRQLGIAQELIGDCYK